MNKFLYIGKGPLHAAASRFHVLEYLRKLDEQLAWKVCVCEHKPRRSLPQNALLRALEDDVLALGGEAIGGYTKQEIHDLTLIEHYGFDKVMVFGRPRLRPKRRTSDLSKTEMTDHIDFVVRFFAEHGIVLSLPGDPM